jgi:hypothetical protein
LGKESQFRWDGSIQIHSIEIEVAKIRIQPSGRDRSYQKGGYLKTNVFGIGPGDDEIENGTLDQSVSEANCFWIAISERRNEKVECKNIYL